MDEWTDGKTFVKSLFYKVIDAIVNIIEIDTFYFT